MKELVFLLEEASAEAMLRGLLPRILPQENLITVRYIVFEGKSDLEKQLVKRLRGYLVPYAIFVILRDQDLGNCREIKKSLVEKCRTSTNKQFIVRIACRELESWYLGDLEAVEKGLDIKNLKRNQNTQPYDKPDSIQKPSERLRNLVPSYQKVSGSRNIGPHLDITNERSNSFACFVSGVLNLVSQALKPD